MTDRAKWGLWVGLSLVWLALIVLRVMNEPDPQRVPLTFKSGQTLARQAARGASGIPMVVRPVRARFGQDTFTTPKNIFAPLGSGANTEPRRPPRARSFTTKAPAPLPSPPVIAAPPPPVPAHAVAPPPPSPAELAARQAQQQMAQYRFLGYLTQAGESRAFLGKGREIYIVKAGDRLDERLQVQTINATAVKLMDPGTSTEATIPLSKDADRGF